MSKDEMIKGMLNMVISAGYSDNKGGWNINGVLSTIYDKGFRDVGELKKWVEEMIEIWEENKMRGFETQDIRLESESHKMISIYQEIFDKLESL